ncbi:MAG TPA: hypothetical protein VMT62_16170 [Syntrophorhabdaceae bacterium]|nr:hypothetical protein [Syntrophorhabdaceae bacterium]
MIIFGFSLSTSDVWLLGTCGFLFMALIGYRLTINAQRHNAFNIAATTFRAKFIAELEGLYPIPVNWPKSIEVQSFLGSKFPKIQSIVEEFRGYLPGRIKKKFDKAWVDYYSATGQEGYQCYHHYMPFMSTYNVDGKQITKDTRDTYKETFKHNVDTLLSFAKRK